MQTGPDPDADPDWPVGALCTPDGRVLELAKLTGYLVDDVILGPMPIHGNRFPIFSFDCRAVSGTTPSICPNADRKPKPEWLPQIERRFRELSLVGDCQTIHWVGSQSKVGHVCGCFQPNNRNDLTPAAVRESFDVANRSAKAHVGRARPSALWNPCAVEGD